MNKFGFLFISLGLSLMVQFASIAAPLTSAGVDLGAAGTTEDWAVLTLGLEVHKGDKGLELGGKSQIVGDIGAAGSGNIRLKGKSVVNGDVSQDTSGELKKDKKSQINGSVFQSPSVDGLLDQAVADALAASDAAYALTASMGYPTTIKANKSLTLSGSGLVVLKLTDFMLSGKSTLTLQGDADTAFVINVGGKFSIDGDASVKLAGGVTWNNVLFNVQAAGGHVGLKGKSELTGILLAPNREVKLSGGAMVSGEVIANAVRLSGKSHVTRPPIVSP